MPLRPLAFTELLDGAFQALRTNPRTMVGLGAIVMAVTTGLLIPAQAWLQYSLGTTLSQAESGEAVDAGAAVTGVVGSFAGVIPPALVQGLATVVLQALLVIAVHGAVLGRRVGAGELWRRTRGRLPAVIGLSVLASLIAAVVLLVAAGIPGGIGIALIAATGLTGRVIGAVLIAVGVALWITAALVMFVRLSLAAPALLLEGLGPVAALRRSWTLTRGTFWRVLGILIVTTVIGGFVSSLIAVPFTLVAFAVDFVVGNSDHTRFLPTLGTTAIISIGSIVANSLVVPWTAAVTALLYLDLRMRREGLDIELGRAAAEGSADAPR